MRKKVFNGCPDYVDGRCSMWDGRQNVLTEGQKAKIVAKIAEQLEVAMRCSYCGLVYTKSGREVFRLGHLDNHVYGEGFKPSNEFT